MMFMCDLMKGERMMDIKKRVNELKNGKKKKNWGERGSNSRPQDNSKL